MGKCINHPDIETSYHCMKHDIYLCQDCLECRDPELYCKFRPSCTIHFLSRKGFDKTPVSQTSNPLTSNKENQSHVETIAENN